MGKPKYYSDEYVAEVVDRYNKGESSQALRKKLGPTPGTILGWVRRLGFPVRTIEETKNLNPKREYSYVDERGILVKNCDTCLSKKEATEFDINLENKDGLRGTCKSCRLDQKRVHYPRTRPKAAQQQKELRKKFPKRFRGYDMKKRFGIGLEDFDLIFEAQGRKCAACGSADSGEAPPRTWHIDHDHSCCPERKKKTCGKCIRGILCRWCNMALGNAKENVDRLEGMVKYLKDHPPKAGK